MIYHKSFASFVGICATFNRQNTERRKEIICRPYSNLHLLNDHYGLTCLEGAHALTTVTQLQEFALFSDKFVSESKLNGAHIGLGVRAWWRKVSFYQCCCFPLQPACLPLIRADLPLPAPIKPCCSHSLTVYHSAFSLSGIFRFLLSAAPL